MCPDRQILSVYFDGELPSPWKEKMESHLERCPQCRRRIEAYRQMSPNRAAPDSPALMEAAKERVWQRLSAAPDAARPLGGVRRYAPGRGGLWARRVSIPLPAAAAVVLLLVLAVLWSRRPAVPAAAPGMTIASEAEIDAPDVIPVSDMDSVLQYLGGRDSGDMLIIRLPESRKFIRSGEPAIIKAADYSRPAPGGRRP
jgi:anti-sigma factor RsiW